MCSCVLFSSIVNLLLAQIHELSVAKLTIVVSVLSDILELVKVIIIKQMEEYKIEPYKQASQLSDLPRVKCINEL